MSIQRNSPNPLVKHRSRSAFTLVEMITVVAIVAILVALVAPALVDVLRSTRMTSAGDALTNRISLAQQNAVALGTEVEIRFYKYDLPSGDLTDPSFNAYQVVQDEGSGIIRPLSEPYYLESGVVFSPLEDLSPVLGYSRSMDTNDHTFTQDTTAVYSALRFYPDGSCKVLKQSSGSGGQTAETDPNNEAQYVVSPLTESFVTLVETTEVTSSTPKNFFCVQIDFYTGKTRTYRP